MFDRVASELTDGTVMIAYTNGEAIASAPFKLLEIERSMAVILFPQLICLVRSLPHVRWKRAIELPKAARVF
jgi:hypothetical protein